MKQISEFKLSAIYQYQMDIIEQPTIKIGQEF